MTDIQQPVQTQAKKTRQELVKENQFVIKYAYGKFYFKPQTDRFNVTVSTIYGRYVVVTPLMPVADQYRVPMNNVHAMHFLRKHANVDIEIPENLDRPVLIPFKGLSVGRQLRNSWYGHLDDLISNAEFRGIMNKQKFFECYDKELEKCGLNYENLSGIEK